MYLLELLFSLKQGFKSFPRILKRSCIWCYVSLTCQLVELYLHDAHSDYSDAVTQKLKELDVEITKLALACREHEGSQANDNDGGPYPAPQRLAGALYKLANELSKRLDVDKVTPAHPWITSELAMTI